jgi:prepilin-type N-terminal cleavage/methylation domain-containing protein
MSRGFSILEVLIVLTIISLLSALSFFYLSSHQRLFKPDEQALKIVDMLQEARQRSLTQRETMRVEIDLTANVVRLIDENQTNTAEDDREIRRDTLAPASDVKMNERPPDISTNPPETLSVPPAQFKTSIYPSSSGHNVCTLRFRRDGSVVNEGTDAIGSNAAAAGMTLFVWSPKKDESNVSEIARAITVVGATGSVRVWEYDHEARASNKWKDSRRAGVYGGGGHAGGGNANLANGN